MCDESLARYSCEFVQARNIKKKSNRQNVQQIASTTSSQSPQMRHKTKMKKLALGLLICAGALCSSLAQVSAASGGEATLSSQSQSALHFDSDTNSYSGLTFSFDPRLDKRVEWLHFEHWRSIMQHASSLMYEALNGRAHLSEVRVLIPYKWRNVEWPVLQKPGVPIIANRRLKYADSDVIVGFDDPIYKETPFSVQHDECGQKGLRINMPIGFLEQNQALDAGLKARQFVREFASHRYGVFKESGFRGDFAYPPFASLAGLAPSLVARQSANSTGKHQRAFFVDNADMGELNASTNFLQENIRGFDENLNECSFETKISSGLPTSNSIGCSPFLVKPTIGPGQSFNLMSADPFLHSDVSTSASASQDKQPVEWRDFAPQSDSIKWHFCGENFSPAASQLATTQAATSTSTNVEQTKKQQQTFIHNQLATNKQNILCNERSALEIIKSSDDFRRSPFGASTFNRLPTPTFKFLQEMPQRLILCVEYTGHLSHSRRLDHGILETALSKYFAYDLVPDTEMALILFGQHQATRNSFKRLDSSVEARLSLFNPPINPFDEEQRFYSDSELASLDVQGAHLQMAKIVKGTCSFGKAFGEAMAALQQRSHYDDLGASILIITSGLFIEDESKIDEIIKSSNFKVDQVELDIIIYPSAMLLDTKSRDSFVVLDALESDAIVKSRISKLMLIQQLTNAKLHFVKEQLDTNGNVKMSTLVQFYQIFEQISRGHSWDQTHATILLDHQPVETRHQNTAISMNGSSSSSSKLNFQFQLDGSVQNELIVGFIEPRHFDRNSGKRFTLRNLQLRSPGGFLVLSDSHPWNLLNTADATSTNLDTSSNLVNSGSSGSASSPTGSQTNEQHANLANLVAESSIFAHRAQLDLAGFHLRSNLLSQLAASKKLAGTWTLSATSDEPAQSTGLAMARVNPEGDTISAQCWIQTYFDSNPAGDEEAVDSSSNGSRSPALKSVKVFVQTRAGAQSELGLDVAARLQVLDEMGNIVQNVHMLDDGLGAPDVTKNDGIHSQFVVKTHRPGFYRVNVELNGANSDSSSSVRKVQTQSGQDNVCCGSFVPQSSNSKRVDTKHLRRQLYCGTFHVDQNNKLDQQRPPRINNLTVANVDQENRRVTIRWFGPHSELISGESVARGSKSGPIRRQSSSPGDYETGSDIFDSAAPSMQDQKRALGFVVGHGPGKDDSPRNPFTSRYEIKLFSDRATLKRAFDAKQEVGFKFTEWNVEGVLPNASSYGGMKEVTLRIPYNREGIYYIAMKVYNDDGYASPISNIIQFWSRNNLTLNQLESMYEPTTVDAYGNVYDKNGELISRAPSAFDSYYSMLSTPGTVTTMKIFILCSFVLFLSSIICIVTVRCLLVSAWKIRDRQGANAKSNGIMSGSSSMVSSSNCSQQSELASSASGSQGGHDVDINKLALAQEEINFGAMQQQHLNQRRQARLIQQAHMLDDPSQTKSQQQQQLAHTQENLVAFSENPYQIHQQQWPQHTMVNGYAYATVMQAADQQKQNQLHQQQAPAGDLNQNGLSPVQSWPADILLSHYDKVKQARERNEAPPVMRIVTLEGGAQLDTDGLPPVSTCSVDSSQLQVDQQQSYLMRDQLTTNYFNQQLQQQLSSVLKSKRINQIHQSEDGMALEGSTPALEGVTDPRDFDMGSPMGPNIHQQPPPPPPQYLYGQVHDESSSIYCPTTGCEQNSYYANQWQVSQQQQEAIYATGQMHLSQQQQQPDQQQDKSAISEV